MPTLLEASTFLGAGVLFWTAVCLVLPRRRLAGVFAGCLGLAAGAVADFVYTLHYLRLGMDVDAIPHERAAQWFVASFGWAGLLGALAAALVRPLRRRLEADGLARR